MNNPFAGRQIELVQPIYEAGTRNVAEAFVRFATAEDCDMALKKNWEFLGKR